MLTDIVDATPRRRASSASGASAHNSLGRKARAATSAAASIAAASANPEVIGQFISFGASKELHLWKHRGSSIRHLGMRCEHQSDIMCATSLPSKAMLLTGGIDSFVQAWDTSVGDVLPLFRLPGHHDAPVVSVCSFVGDLLAAVVDARGSVRLWNVSRQDTSGDDSTRLLQAVPAPWAAAKTSSIAPKRAAAVAKAILGNDAKSRGLHIRSAVIVPPVHELARQ